MSPDPSGTSQAQPDVQAPDAGLALAYEAACDLLRMQDATLGNVRSRATQVLSTAALLTSISAGLGIINLDPKRGEVLAPSGAWALLVLTVLIGALTTYVHWPIRGWIFGPSASKILAERSHRSDVDHLREFVLQALVKGIDGNDHALKRKQKAFRTASLALVVEVLAIAAAVA
ncbi:hypothetical protein [Nocardioides sp.]|uniref:hypothetical protein n=1 Tax=Nocardioides sp. TaxID=35761 RepID=UPI002C21BCD2|nr:hypothetical protein [Nocardioides sp.]HXH80056.1 hypothetical protein [Nocardioides sp.]